MNSLEGVRAFQIELEFGSVGFFFLRRGEVPEYPKKNLSKELRERTNNKLNQDMACAVQQDSVEPGHIGVRRVLSPPVTFAPHERHLIVTT